MNKAVIVARKTLVELVREPLLIGIFLTFPFILLGFFYIAYGQSKEGVGATLRVLVINQDRGAADVQAGQQLVSLLRAVRVEGRPVFDVTATTDHQYAEIALRERKSALLITIPAGFSQQVAAAQQGGSEVSPAAIRLTGDVYSDNFLLARSVLDDLVRGYVGGLMGWDEDKLRLHYEYVTGDKMVSDFEFGVPGVMVFGVMFVMISTAQLLVRENVGGTLRRLRLTRLSARDLLLGITLAQMIIAVFQIPMTLLLAVLMGFNSEGSLLLASGIGLLLSLCAVGMGLVVACFARSDGEAANLASGILAPLVFLSGAMFPLPDATLLTIGGRAIQAYDILPPTPASEALRQMLLYGKGVNAIGYELVALTVLSFLSLTAGIVLYRRMRLQP
jgi:ABC-2 type transport system permease protein